MKCLLSAVFLIAGAGSTYGGVIESIAFNLSQLHPGSILSGSVTLASPLTVGSSTPITLTFSDPSDYSPISLTTTLSMETGTSGLAERFTPLTFTNLANNSTINLMLKAPAQCVVGPSNPSGVPCTATGLWQDHDPARFSGTYTVTATTATPEPGYGLLLAVLMLSAAIGRRALRVS